MSKQIYIILDLKSVSLKAILLTNAMTMVVTIRDRDKMYFDKFCNYVS